MIDRISNYAGTESQCPGSSPDTLLDRFPSHTRLSLEAGARGAGNLARPRSQPSNERFHHHHSHKVGITCQLTQPPTFWGCYGNQTWREKEGGHRGGGQSPQELTAGVPLSQIKGGTGRRPAGTIPWSFYSSLCAGAGDSEGFSPTTLCSFTAGP